MKTTAVVTGGTRGPGRVTAAALQNAGCRDGLRKIEEDPGPVDIRVNDVGIMRDATLHHKAAKQWTGMIKTNLGSMFNMCHNLVTGMRARGFGRIINIPSINTQKGQFGQTNYSAAKAGIIGFAKALAQETAAKRITANAVAPGYCDTDMLAAPDDVIERIVAARQITAHLLTGMSFTGSKARQTQGKRNAIHRKQDV